MKTLIDKCELIYIELVNEFQEVKFNKSKQFNSFKIRCNSSDILDMKTAIEFGDKYNVIIRPKFDYAGTTRKTSEWIITE
jgi:hypothetical protein